MSAFGLSEPGLCLIFSLNQHCVLENNSLCPLKKEVEGVIFFCGFMELYSIVCLQGRCDARWLCSYAGMERQITVDAASGMLQQEGWRAKRQPAFLPLLQHPLDFVPRGLGKLSAGGAAP